MHTDRVKGKRKRRGWERSFFSWLIVLGVIVGCYYFLSLPIWQINEVRVNGAKMLLPDEIRALAGIPISENLFFTSFRRAKNNLAKVGAIKSFRFFRLPPGTVIISIKERTPAASVVFTDGSAIIDHDGFILNHIPNLTLDIPELADLPIITGLDRRTEVEGDRLSRRANSVISGIVKEINVSIKTKRLQMNLGGLQNIDLLLDDILLVKIGRADELERKLDVIKQLLRQVAGQWERVQYLDVRFPAVPVILYKS